MSQLPVDAATITESQIKLLRQNACEEDNRLLLEWCDIAIAYAEDADILGCPLFSPVNGVPCSRTDARALLAGLYNNRDLFVRFVDGTENHYTAVGFADVFDGPVERLRGGQTHWSHGADIPGAYRSTGEIRELLATGRRLRIAY